MSDRTDISPACNPPETFKEAFARTLREAQSNWDAGRALSEREWCQTTADVADHFLGCVPPIYPPSGADWSFACGECSFHNANGHRVYLAFRNINWKANTAEAAYVSIPGSLV